jgi:aquaporin Z
VYAVGSIGGIHGLTAEERWQPALQGLHLPEWACELAGTAILMFCGLSVVSVDFGHGMPLSHAVAAMIPARTGRLLMAGVFFGGVAALVSITPLGRRSGAHLNPSVTFGFWLTGHVSRTDLVGYTVAQCLGATLGVIALVLVWGRIAVQIFDVRTVPGRGIGAPVAAALEVVMTAALLLTIFAFTSRPRLARWTPLAVWLVLAVLIWQGAPLTGTSLNPARTLGADLVANDLSSFWVYVAGPLVGAALAAGVVKLAHTRIYPLTAKYFHHRGYRSVFKTALPTAGRERS